MRKEVNSNNLMSMNYDQFIKFSNKMMHGKGIKQYVVSNGQTWRKWRFIKGVV